MSKKPDAEVVERFVLRARRVREHSLMKDRAQLVRWAEGHVDAVLDLSGNATARWPLPEDEEVFESLAARLRPLTLAREPIHYKKLFPAIEARAKRPFTDTEQDQLGEMSRAWDAAEIQDSHVRGYAVQQSNADRTEITGLVSDTQLAAGWLYADLVHAHATGPKAEALDFDLEERYSSAVRLFSHLALLTDATLRLIETLRDAGAIEVDASAWVTEVVVSKTEIVHEARIFIADVGTEMPDMRETFAMGEGWRSFRPTELLRMKPGNAVRVALLADDEEVLSYDAVVIHRSTGQQPIDWHVLVAECATFKFSIDVAAGQAELQGVDLLTTTNELKLAAIRYLIALQDADSVMFEIGGHELIRLAPPKAPTDRLRELHVMEEVFDDIVAIERLRGEQFGLSNGGFNDDHRVRLRWARRLWEGSVVQTWSKPLAIVTDEDISGAVLLPADTIDLGGAMIPAPPIAFRHQAMTVSEERTGDNDVRYRVVSPPTGERFLAWAPEQVLVTTDEDLASPLPWTLLGIDEDTFPI